MNMQKRIMTIVACGIMAMAVGAGQSFADVTCNSATITDAGIYSWNSAYASNYTLSATCDDVPTVWSGEITLYIVKNADLAKSMYGTALTAISDNQKVRMLLSGDTENSLVYTIAIDTIPPGGPQ